MNPIATARSSTVACFVALCGAVSTPAAAACLAASGGDDTAALQAELDRCSNGRARCEVRLCAGVFRTGILRVADFRGTLRGAGPLQTTLRALPNLAVNPRGDGFFRDDPFDPGSAPWPYLLQFVGGRAQIRDLGVHIPEPAPPDRPTTGWTLFEDPFDPTFRFYELRGGILLTGASPVDFELTRVRVEAARDAQSPVETTAFGGVEFAGLLFDPAGAEPFPVRPLTGSLLVADSEILGTASGSPVSELAAASVRLRGNRYRAGIAVDVIDVDRSQIEIAGNRWRTSYRGVQVLQNLDGVPSRSSTVIVEDNTGTLNPMLADVGDVVAFQDPVVLPEPGGTELRVAGNRLRQRDGLGPAASGITAIGALRPRLYGNRISGLAGVGMAVDEATGCLVWGNSFGQEGSGPDLRLGAGTSRCLAFVNRRDSVEDLGSGNRVLR
jgi:hypothetical protein